MAKYSGFANIFQNLSSVFEENDMKWKMKYYFTVQTICLGKFMDLKNNQKFSPPVKLQDFFFKAIS